MSIKTFMGSNSDALLQFGAGLLAGRTAPEQIGLGVSGFAQARKDGKTRNATMEWLRANNPEIGSLVETGAISPTDAVKMAWEQKNRSEKPQNPFMSAGGSLYNWQTGEWVTPPGGGAAAGGDYGKTPVLMQDAQGNVVVGQLSGDNRLSPAKMPDGYNVLSPYEKSLQGSQGTTEGKSQGENVVSLQSMKAKLPSLEKNIQELSTLADKATYTTAGKAWNWLNKEVGGGPTEGAIARTEYLAKIDNQILPLLKDTFGSQFTDAEGLRLRNTLGDPDLSPQEKKATLDAFIEQKKRDIEALSAQLGQGQGQAQPQVRKRYNPATGRIE